MVTNTTQTQAVATIVTQTMVARAISVKSLAEATHIPRTTLTRRLSGSSAFTLTELSAIADVLDESVVALMAAADAARAVGGSRVGARAARHEGAQR